MSDPLVHSAWVRAATSEPRGVMLFLHGILGTGGNLRSLAQSFVQSELGLAVLLVDLRLHGRSRAFSGPHDVHACARDLCALEQTLTVPVVGVLGHSFGGKVALAYHALRPDLARVVTLDSDPGHRPDRVGSEQTMSVLDMLEQLPRTFSRREDFIEQVHARGHARAIADWLAMNLERGPDGFTFRVDLAGVRALLDSYFSLDLWPVIEHSTARLDIVIGGRSQVWDHVHRVRIEALARQRPERLRVHVLPEAGHWVHADDPAGLRAALLPPEAQAEIP